MASSDLQSAVSSSRVEYQPSEFNPGGTQLLHRPLLM